MSKIRLLIIEDDATETARFKLILEQAGYEVFSLTGRMKDTRREVADLQPDVILQDIFPRGSIEGAGSSVNIFGGWDIPIIYLIDPSDEEFLKKVGQALPLDYLITPIQAKELLSSLDRTVFKHRTERHLKHLTSLMKAMREINRLINQERQPGRLLDQACRVLNETHGYQLVWIEQLYPSTSWIWSLTNAGDKTGCLSELSFLLENPDNESSPLISDILAHKFVTCNDILSDPQADIIFRKAAACGLGLRSGTLVPIFHKEQIWGVIGVYSNQRNVFDDEEIALLQELAADLAYALKLIEEEGLNTSRDKALQESEARYRQIIDTATEGIMVTDSDVQIVFANPHMANFLGYSLEEILKKDLRSFYFEEDLKSFKERIAVMKTGATARFERRLKRKDGGTFWSLVSGTPIVGADQIFQGTLLMFTDITEQKQTEDQLKRRITELEVIYENGPALGSLLTPKEIGQKIIEILSNKLPWRHILVMFMNPKTDLLELTAFNHADLSPDALSHEKERLQCLINEKGQALGDWVFQNGKSFLCENVTINPHHLSTFEGIKSGIYAPIKGGGKWLGVISIESTQAMEFDENDLRFLSTVALQAGIAMENARLYQMSQNEISVRKRIEDELLVLNKQLEQRVTERTEELRLVNATMEQASRMKDEFMASMSHELRTPLTSVLNLSEVLQEQVYGALNQKQIQLLQTIESSGRHLLGLINDILDLSKIESGMYKLQMEDCSLNDICQVSLQLIRGMAQKKNQNVSFSIKPSHIELYGDARRLKQMLVNLLSNSIKFTPEGGNIGLQVEGDVVLEEVHFTVWDTGLGIDQEDMPKLFKPFSQLESDISINQSGTGLGLMLVKRMVDLHHGTIRVMSTPGEGSRFVVTLPWKIVPSKDNTPPVQVEGASSSFEGDSLQAIDQLNTYLWELGISNTVCDRPDKAYEKVLETWPNFILLEDNLEDRSSMIEFLHHMKSNSQTNSIPIWVVSQMHNGKDHVLEVTDTVISKPLIKSVVHDQLIRLKKQESKTPTRSLTIGFTCTAGKILIVDDNEVNLNIYVDYLRTKGYWILTAQNGGEAIQLAQEALPDIILMDIQMPGMDGLSAIQQIRANPDRLASIPIIALTALAMPGDREHCLAAGADDYLSKPFSLNELMTTIKNHFRKV